MEWPPGTTMRVVTVRVGTSRLPAGAAAPEDRGAPGLEVSGTRWVACSLPGS